MDPFSPRQIRSPNAASPTQATRASLPHDADASAPDARKALVYPTHYQRLGVPAEVDEVTLSDAYRQAAAAAEAGDAPPPLPPSTGFGTDTLWPQPGQPENDAVRRRQLQVAYEVLQDPQRRAVYNQWLAQEEKRLQAAQAAQQGWLSRPATRWTLLALAGLALVLLLVWLRR